WTFDKNVYQVYQSVEVRTPEGLADLALTVTAGDDKKGNRVWRMQPPQPTSVRRRQYTELGRLLGETMVDADRAGKEWMRQLSQRRYAEAALLLRPPADRERLQRLAKAQAAAAVGLTPAGAAGLPTGVLRF